MVSSGDIFEGQTISVACSDCFRTTYIARDKYLNQVVVTHRVMEKLWLDTESRNQISITDGFSHILAFLKDEKLIEFWYALETLKQMWPSSTAPG